MQALGFFASLIAFKMYELTIGNSKKKRIDQSSTPPTSKLVSKLFPKLKPEKPKIPPQQVHLLVAFVNLV